MYAVSKCLINLAIKPPRVTSGQPYKHSTVVNCTGNCATCLTGIWTVQTGPYPPYGDPLWLLSPFYAQNNSRICQKQGCICVNLNGLLLHAFQEDLWQTIHVQSSNKAVWPDWTIYWTLGNFLKPLATINLPKSPIFLGNFCKGVKNLSFF